MNVSSILDETTDIISYELTKGIFNQSNGVWTIDNLDMNESQSLILILKFNEYKKFIKTSFEAVSEAYSVNENVSAFAIVDYARDNLSLDVNANASYYYEGDLIKFNLTISNDGGYSCEVNVSSILDETTDIVSYELTKGRFNQSNGVWTIDNLNRNESQSLILILRFNEYKEFIKTSFEAVSEADSVNDNVSAFAIVYYASHTEFLSISDINAKLNSNPTVSIGLVDIFNNLIKNKDIEVSLIGSSNSYAMNPIHLNTGNGFAAFNLNLPAGDYRFKVSFDGDGRLDPSSTQFSASILKIDSSIIANDLNANVIVSSVDGKSGKYLKIILKDEYGNALSGKAIEFTYNNKKYTRTTDNNGEASLQINIAKAGTYSFRITFAGDSTYGSASKTVKVTLKKQSLKLAVKNKKYKLKSKKKYLTATLKNSKGKAIKNKKITFKLNGKKYTAKTNKKGIAKVKVKINRKKTYKFTVSFAGDSSYKAVSKKAKISIK